MDARKLVTKLKKQVIQQKNISTPFKVLHFNDEVDLTSAPPDHSGNIVYRVKDKKRLTRCIKQIQGKWDLTEFEIIELIDYLIIENSSLKLYQTKGPEKETKETLHDLEKISQIIQRVEVGDINELQMIIRIKSKGLSKSKNVKLESDLINSKIYQLLKSFPDPDRKPHKRGRPPGSELTTIIHRQFAKVLADRFSHLTKDKNELYDLISWFFVAAGILNEESEYSLDKLSEYQEYRISNIKGLISKEKK